MNFVVLLWEFFVVFVFIGVEEGGDLSWGDVIGECFLLEVEDFLILDKCGGVLIFWDDVRFLEILEFRFLGFVFGDVMGGWVGFFLGDNGIL